MASNFSLQVVTPAGVVFEGDVEGVTAFGPLGQFGVLAEHMNLITSLWPGALEIRQAGGASHRWIISGGLAEVKDGAMTVLARGAELPDAIVRASAIAEEQAAADKLATMSTYDPAYEAVRDAALLASARALAAAGPETEN